MFRDLFRKYVAWRSSIYSQVVYVIVLMSVILYISFAFLFRSTNEKYMQDVLEQCGQRIAYLVQGSLYNSMLENNKDDLRNMLSLISDMPGIDEVNIYDHRDSLAFTLDENWQEHSEGQRCTPDCRSCHSPQDSLFAVDRKITHLVSVPRKLSDGNRIERRSLIIISPVMNEKACFTSDCHVHPPDQARLGALAIKIPLQNLDSALKTTTAEYFILALITTIILIIILIFFTRRKINQPLARLIRASEEVAAGNMDTRLDTGDYALEDMNKVSSAFNHMLDQLNKANSELQVWSRQLEYKVQKKTEELKETQNELIHIERMASLGKLSSSVAHEINNPLAGVLTYTKLVNKQLQKEDIQAEKKASLLNHLSMIEKETKRCGDIVKGLLDFSRKDQTRFEEIHLQTVLRETYELMLHPMKMADVQFSSRFQADYDLVLCSPNQIKQACIALLVNASEAVSEQGEVSFSCLNDPDDSSWLMIQIADNGTGIGEDDLPHIFEPFFSRKQKTSGIGLGLSVVHGIMESHKGRISVDSRVGRGTVITLRLPLLGA